jgi:hypothetical protein
MMRYFVILLMVSSLAAAEPPKSGAGRFGVTKGLVLHLTFDAGGKQILDKTPSKNHAAVHNATFIAKGRSGGAYNLDGKGDYLRIANSPSIEIRDAVTASVWVKLNSFGPKGYANENGYIINKGDDYWWNPAIGLGYSKGAQKALFHIGSPAARRTGIKTVHGVTKLQVGKWYHLAGTYDGAVSKLYVNGKLEKSMPFKGRMRADKAPVLLGGGHLGSGEFHNQFTVDGAIDDVMIWNRALSADEVRSIAIGAPVGVPYISRETKLDRVVLRDGTVFKGEITNKRYVMTTSQGKIEIPAARVIGIASAGAKDKTLRVVLDDSQVIRGRLVDQKLEMHISGSQISISFDDVVECGYRITAAKSDKMRFYRPMVSLQDGQRLQLSEFKTKLQITTDYGKVDIPGKGVFTIQTADEKLSRHVVSLANGTKLSGVLAPKKWSVELLLGGKLEIAGDKLLALTSPGVPVVGALGGVTMKMLNGDVIYGNIAAKSVGIRTEFGEISPDVAGIKSIVITPGAKLSSVMTMRSGAVHRGRLSDKQLSIRVAPNGVTVKAPPAAIASLTWRLPGVLPKK